MQHYSILTILPSNKYDILTLPSDHIENLVNNKNLINGIIGPLLNIDDIENAAAYYIYCNISKQNYDNNILLTNLINKEIDDYYVNGQVFIIKKYENRYTNITNNEIGTILNILNNPHKLIIKIKSVNVIEINEINKNNDMEEINFMDDMLLNIFCFFNPL